MKTHWKKLANPDYLGAYALDPGKDMILTIKSVAEENITGADGKKEDCIVMRFRENVKPMIINATNAKMIQKIYHTPYIEDWSGCKIQLYVDQVKAFGEVVDALRIRPYVPKAEQSEATAPVCADCGKEIVGLDEKHTAAYLAGYTQKHYGKPLCADCAKRRAEQEKQTEVSDPLADGGAEGKDSDLL